ncbi:hypothetical protein FACS189479_07850 [Spirochaetia bacterium]|nr:hypothetical protein FACS189479_07850 [Spirochaetia bacterium]
MKKILVVFLALAVAGGLFAQIPDGFKLDGQIRTGIWLVSPDNDAADSDPQILLGGRGDPGEAARVRFNTGYNQGNFGWDARFRMVEAANNDLTANRVDVDIYQVWFTLLDSKLKFNLGNMDYEHPLRSPGYLGSFGDTVFYGSGWHGDTNNLALIQFKPIDGLTIAANLGGNTKAEDLFLTANYGVRYEKDGIIGMAAIYGTGHPNADEDYNGTIRLAGGYQKDAFKIVVDAAISGLGKDSIDVPLGPGKTETLSPLSTTAYLKGSYGLDKLTFWLTVGGTFADDINDKGDKVLGMPLIFVPAVKYGLNDKINLELDAKIGIRNHKNTTNAGAATFDSHGTDAYKTAAFYDDPTDPDKSADIAIGVGPSVEIKLGPQATIMFFDQLHFSGELFDNNFGIDFRWSF